MILLKSKKKIYKIRKKKLFTNYVSNKTIISSTYKELLQFNNQKENYSVLKKKNQAKDLSRRFSKKDTQVKNKDIRKCSKSSVIKET